MRRLIATWIAATALALGVTFQATAHPPPAHLGTVIEAGRAALYKARNAAQVDAAQERLRRALAAHPGVTDGALAREIRRLDELQTALHRGPTRFYPAPRTAEVWARIRQALAQAREDLKVRQQATPSPSASPAGI